MIGTLSLLLMWQLFVGTGNIVIGNNIVVRAVDFNPIAVKTVDDYTPDDATIAAGSEG